MKIIDAREPCTCPKCGKRNTNELGPPNNCGAEVAWEWECYDCGIEYTVHYEVVSFSYDENQPTP